MAAPLLDEDAEGARIRGAVNGAGAHAPASRTVDDLEWEVSDLRGQLAERDATITNLRTRLTAALIELEQARGERREALALRDGYAARLAAAVRASASIPAPAPGPWSEADREAYLLGYVSADEPPCLRCGTIPIRGVCPECGHTAPSQLPAAAGPATNGQPSPPDSTAPAGSGADPSPERGRAVPAPSRPGAWILPRVTR